MIESIFYLSSTPRKCWCVKHKGSHQTVSSELTPRELHPTVGLTEPPSLSAAGWLPLGLWLNGSIIVLFAGHGGIGSCPIFWVGISRSLPFGRSWRTAAHAYAFHNHKKEVFGEWVFGCQRTVPVFVTQRKMGRRLFTLHPIVLENPYISLYLKKFFSFSLSLSIRL